MKYIGVTIGPIYKTMKQAKKTRELWASSYMFSYILREIAKEFERDFILPKKDESVKEIGVFNDRFIFKAKEGDIEELEKKIDKVLKKFSKENNIDFEFLKEYLQIHYVEVEVNDLEKENIVEKVYKYLDSKELFFNTTQKDDLKRFFKNIHKSKMMEFAFGKDKKFPTLLEIALGEYEKKLSQEELKVIRGFEDEKNLDLEELFKNKKIPNYHKYIAIVKADGDNMGAVNKLLKTEEDYKNLSNDLFEFVKEANEKIKKFKGKVILGSGDDLLFIAPVAYEDKNILDLVFELKELYTIKMKPWNKQIREKEKFINNKILSLSKRVYKDLITKNFMKKWKNSTFKQTSLSVGISISYYKYPLFEAFELVNDLLFDKAKQIKNCTAFSVIKHSGQNFYGIVPENLEGKIKELIKKEFKFFSSIIYKLDTNKYMLDYLGKNKKDFLPFFENNFNENFDEEMFSKLADFLTYIYEDKNTQEEIFLLYSVLRFNHFIKDNDEKNNQTKAN